MGATSSHGWTRTSELHGWAIDIERYLEPWVNVFVLSRKKFPHWEHLLHGDKGGVPCAAHKYSTVSNRPDPKFTGAKRSAIHEPLCAVEFGWLR